MIFSAIYNEESNEVSVFALNTNKNENSETEINLGSFGSTEMIFRTELCGKDLAAKNSLENPEAVKPQEVLLSQAEKSVYNLTLKAASWNVIRFKVNK